MALLGRDHVRLQCQMLVDLVTSRNVYSMPSGSIISGEQMLSSMSYRSRQVMNPDLRTVQPQDRDPPISLLHSSTLRHRRTEEDGLTARQEDLSRSPSERLHASTQLRAYRQWPCRILDRERESPRRRNWHSLFPIPTITNGEWVRG
jgi:hypothetical protein